jgi:hypothetical protein
MVGRYRPSTMVRRSAIRSAATDDYASLVAPQVTLLAPMIAINYHYKYFRTIAVQAGIIGKLGTEIALIQTETR